MTQKLDWTGTTEKKWGRLTKWLDPKKDQKYLSSWLKWMRSKGKGAYIKKNGKSPTSCVMVYQEWSVESGR